MQRVPREKVRKPVCTSIGKIPGPVLQILSLHATEGKKSKAEEGSELHVLIKEAKNLSAVKSGRTCDSFVKGCVDSISSPFILTALFFPVLIILSLRYLLPSKSKNNSKRKTQVVKKTLSPHYDHTFVYKDLSLEQLKDMCLELTVWDREALSSNDFLGGVRLSLGSGSRSCFYYNKLFQVNDILLFLAKRSCVLVYPMNNLKLMFAVTVKEGKSEWVADSTGEEISLWQKMMQYPDSWAEGTLSLRSSMGKGK